MSGTIGLRGLRITCVIGTADSERSRPQQLEVDLEVDFDLSTAAESDRIGDTVDYRLMARQLAGLAEQRRFFLIEAYAEAAADYLLECWPALEAVRLEVRKPGAVEAADHSFCRLERRRV